MNREAGAAKNVACRGAPCCDVFRLRWRCARRGGYGWWRALLHALAAP